MSRFSASTRKAPTRAARAALPLLCLTLVAGAPAHAQLPRSGAGAGATTARDQFRLDLGGGTTAGANGLFSDATGARREINWDGTPDAFSAPGNLPANFFNVNSPRGVLLASPGIGLQVSADTTPAAPGTTVEFGNLDASYTGTFATFSPQRLFTALGSNIVDVSFFLPGTSTPAGVRGFGSIFTDVDLPNTTSIEYFDLSNASLGTFFVPNVAGADETLSFLGVSYASPLIGRVRITSGNVAPGAGVLDQNGNPNDVVAMDDFLYTEPQVLNIPEPGTLALAAGLLPLAAARLRRKHRA